MYVSCGWSNVKMCERNASEITFSLPDWSTRLTTLMLQYCNSSRSKCRWNAARLDASSTSQTPPINIHHRNNSVTLTTTFAFSYIVALVLDSNQTITYHRYKKTTAYPQSQWQWIKSSKDHKVMASLNMVLNTGMQWHCWMLAGRNGCSRSKAIN